MLNESEKLTVLLIKEQIRNILIKGRLKTIQKRQQRLTDFYFYICRNYSY